MMKDISQLTVEDARSLVDSKIYQRGVGYFAEGCVVNPTVLGNEIRAEVEGSSSSNYNTIVRLDGGKLICECDCPYDWGTCKHVVALLLHWVKKRKDFEDLGRVADKMERLPREALLRIIRRFAKEEPQRFGEIADLELGDEMAEKSEAPDFLKKAKNILRNGEGFRITEVVRRINIIREQVLGRLKSRGPDYTSHQLFKIACAFLEAPEACEDSKGEGIGQVSEILGDIQLIWVNYKISKKIKKQILEETWNVINEDATLLIDSFDDFFEYICEGEWERKIMRKPVVQKLVQFEEHENSRRKYRSYRYEQTLHFARKFGYINQKGVYLQD